MTDSTQRSIVHRGLSNVAIPKNLCDWSNRCHDSTKVHSISEVTVGCLLRAVARDVASLSTLVASLASSIQRSAVGGSAIPGYVTELAASIALHGLCLAISSKVVWTTALVASSRARSTSESTARGESASKSSTGSTKATSSTWDRSSTSRGWARTSQMSWLTTVIASSTGSSSAQTKSWAIGLDVSKALAVIALLCLGSSWQRASVRLVSGLLAVVAETLS